MNKNKKNQQLNLQLETSSTPLHSWPLTQLLINQRKPNDSHVNDDFLSVHQHDNPTQKVYKSICMGYYAVKLIEYDLIINRLNPLTPMSDQDRISP